MKISIANIILLAGVFVSLLGWSVTQWIRYENLQAKVADDDGWIRDTRAWTFVANFPNDPWSVQWKQTHRWIDRP